MFWRICWPVLLLALLHSVALPRGAAVRFDRIEIMIDSGSVPVAAWQIRFVAEGVPARLAGIEGGEPEAYREPPHYDPAALQRDEVILAAYSIERDLPAGKFRVATLTLMVEGDANPDYSAELMAAAGADGETVPVQIQIIRGETR